MPEGVGYGPQDTASTGLNLNVIGNHAYGYSGVLDVGGTETDLLSFETGNFYLVGTIQFQYVELQGESFAYKMYLNGIEAQGFLEDSGSSGAVQPPTTFINILIPPYTKVRCTAENITDSATRNQLCNIVGKIYK